MATAKRALFITLEGGEGAGKTTLIHKMESELRRRGYDVVKTREPGGSKLGEHIRRWLLNRDFSIDISSRAELMLFLAGRVQHIEELIKPALNAGKIVLCDRFNDSTVAYQGVARHLGFETVLTLCSQVCEGLTPDLTFFLDLDPVVGLKRTQHATKENASSGHLDRIEAEKLEFHHRVRQGLQKLAQMFPNRICTLDASQSVDQVFKASLVRLIPLLEES